MRASAADLKFLHRLRQTHSRNFKSKSGTGIINLLVPLCFRSSCVRGCRNVSRTSEAPSSIDRTIVVHLRDTVRHVSQRAAADDPYRTSASRDAELRHCNVQAVRRKSPKNHEAVVDDDVLPT